MTHKELVLLAYKWACSRSYFAFRELTTMAGEIPDVIAFGSAVTVIEVKVSKSDFYADQKKHGRKTNFGGMGEYRIYCAPKGLLRLDMLPKGWGLLEADEKGKLRLVENVYDWKYREKYRNVVDDIGRYYEWVMMKSALRRLWIRDRAFFERIYEPILV